MRSADSFDEIRARVEELRTERQVAAQRNKLCPASGASCMQDCTVDDKGTVFCKVMADNTTAGYLSMPLFWNKP